MFFLKKLKGLLFFLGSFLFLAIGSNQVASASTVLPEGLEEQSIIKVESVINLTGEPVIDYENLQITESNGSMILFDNLEDMNTYVAALENLQKDKIGTYVFGETIVDTQYKYYQFMGYSKHTAEWCQCTDYTVLSSQSETFSHKVTTDWGDVTASFSYSSGVNRKIDADKSRWSKLAGYADLKIERVKITQPSFGTLYTTRVKTTNKYLAVRYK